MNLEDLGKDTYPELLFGAAKDLVKDLELAEAARLRRAERRSRRRSARRAGLARLLGGEN